MNELLAIFANHRDCEVSRRHLYLLRKHGGADVIPAHLHERGAIGVDFGPTGHNYSRGDAFLYRARKAYPGYQTYIILDWDCRVTGPLREILDSVWDAPLSAPSIATTHWCVYEWGNGLVTLPEDLKTYACGCVPLCGTMAAGTLLDAVSDAEEQLPNTHCELRIATLAHHATGVLPKAWARPWAQHVRPVQCELPNVEITIRHPVKS
jgi:hypothetical protein